MLLYPEQDGTAKTAANLIVKSYYCDHVHFIYYY